MHNNTQQHRQQAGRTRAVLTRSEFAILGLFLIVEMGLFLLPEVAEARRGGRGGTLWWIPIVIIGGIIYAINKIIPELWSWIGGLAVMLFLSFLGAGLLQWLGLIEREQMLLSVPFIFIAITFGPYLFHKIRQYVSKWNGT